MARIAGINIPVNKHVVIGLTHIFGVGHPRAESICAAAGVSPTTARKVSEKRLSDRPAIPARSSLRQTPPGLP